MTIKAAMLPKRVRILLHTLGLSSIGGAIFLQALVFIDIFQSGYFTAVERNSLILSFEIALTAFALLYFIYIYQRLMRQIK